MSGGVTRRMSWMTRMTEMTSHHGRALERNSSGTGHSHFDGADSAFGEWFGNRSCTVAGSLAFGGLALLYDAEIMRGTGGLEFDIANCCLIVEPVEDAFVFIWADHLRFSDVDSAADWNQQEGMQRIGAETTNEFENFGKLDGIVLRDRHVDLDGHSEFFEIAEAIDGGIEGSGNSAERIMRFGVGSIEGDADAFDAGVNDLLCDLFGDESSVGRQSNAQSAFGGVSCELENIRT